SSTAASSRGTPYQKASRAVTARTAVSRTLSEVIMGTTVTPRAARGHHGKVSVVDIAAARRLGVRPATVHDRVHRRGIHIELAAVIACAVEAGHLELADRLFEPIAAARHGIPGEPFTPALVLEVQRADL